MGPPPPPTTRWHLLAAAAAMAGIQISYSAQINEGSSQLLALGLDESKVSLAWLAGPLSGILVQPLVGVASDACTSRFGRRRPFLVGGSVCTAASLLMFSNAEAVAALVFPFRSGAQLQHAALGVAVLAFFLLDFSIQAIQAPLRALITDIASSDLLPVGNVYIALFTGMGNLVGSLLASLELSKLLPFFSSDTQALFFIAALVLVTTVTLCVCSVTETPLEPDLDVLLAPTEEEDALARALATPASAESGIALSTSNPTIRTSRGLGLARVRSSPSMWSLGIEDWSPRTRARGAIGGGAPAPTSGAAGITQTVRDTITETQGSWAYKLLAEAPRPFWRVFVVQLFTWFGFFSLFVFVNAWVGTNVYLGEGTAPHGSEPRNLFEAGVRLGGVGNALTALVTVVFSMIIPKLLQRFGILRTYAFSQAVEAMCLLSAHHIRGTPGQSAPSTMLKLATVLDIGAFGIVWATTMGVPWAIIGKALSEDERYQPRIGLFTTLFNVSQSFPQLFVSFGSPFILSMYDNDVSAVMFVGGVLAMVGMVLVFALRVDIFADGNVGHFGDDEGSSDEGVDISRDLEEISQGGNDEGVSISRGINKRTQSYSGTGTSTVDGREVREPFLGSTG